MWNESVIVALAFFVFVPLVFKPVKGLLLSFVDKYVADAIKNLDESRAMRKEAERLLLEIKKQELEAKRNAKDIIDSSRQDVEEIMADMKEEIKNLTKVKVDLSVAKITQQEKQIIENLKNEAIRIAIENVQTALVNELDKSAQLSLIDNNLKDIKKLVH